MKKWVFGIGGGLVLILVLALIAVFLSLNSIVKGGVEKVGPRLTKTEVRLEGVSLSPFSGSGQLNGLVVRNPEGYKTESAFKVGEISVALKVGSVFSDTVDIHSIAIRDPEITFEGGLGGNNLSKILENVEAAVGGGDPEAEGKRLRVQDIQITGGKVHASITGLGEKVITAELPPVQLRNVGTTGEGVTAAELTRELIKELLKNATAAVAANAGGLSKEIGETGKAVTDKVDKAKKGLQELLKKP